MNVAPADPTVPPHGACAGTPAAAGEVAPATGSAAGDDAQARTPDGSGELELAARLRVAVGRLNRALRQHDPGRLTATQISALLVVNALGPLRIGDLAARERVSAPTMTRVVDTLENADLLARSVDPADGRGSLVAVTPRGRSRLEAVSRERNTQLERRIAALSPEQRAALIAALPALEALNQY